MWWTKKAIDPGLQRALFETPPITVTYQRPADIGLFKGRSIANEAIKRDKGPIAYAGNYQQRPTPRGGNIIKRDWWQLWREPQFPPLEYIVASLDTAFTDKTSNDQSALTIWGLFRRTETRFNRLGGRYESVSSPRMILLYAWARHLVTI